MAICPMRVIPMALEVVIMTGLAIWIICQTSGLFVFRNRGRFPVRVPV
jgi:hypothetical protein